MQLLFKVFLINIIFISTLMSDPIQKNISSVHLNEKEVPWPEIIPGANENQNKIESLQNQDYQRMSEVMRWKTLIGTEGRFGEALPDPDMAFGIGELGPGAIYPNHRHPSPELYYFLSGSAKWNVDGEEFIATPGSTVYMKPYAIHSLEIISDESAIVIWADWSPNGDMEAMQTGYELLERVPKQPETAKINKSN